MDKNNTSYAILMQDEMNQERFLEDQRWTLNKIVEV